MAKYRTIVTDIEADQWFPGKLLDGVYNESDSSNEKIRYFVVTIHQQKVYLEPGDWVIIELDGKHYYPIKDFIFKKRYKLVEE